MDCIICGQQVINENNQLQRKVKEYQKLNRELDTKHQWMKEWKICFECSERYSNKMLTFDREVLRKIEEQKTRKEVSRNKKERKFSSTQLAYYTEKYIDYATEKAENSGVTKIKRPHLKNKHQYEKAYIDYIERSESTAVYIVRDLVEAIDTRGKWIDIRLIEKRFLSQLDDDFSFIISEIFNRKQRPVYPRKMEEESDLEYRNRIAYITWQTATSDIKSQRAQGIKGDVYLILPVLKDVHENQYEKHFIAWDTKRAHFKRVRKSNISVDIIKAPKWEYAIVAVKKINAQQLKFIEKNKFKIISKTHKKRAVTLSMFEPQKNKNSPKTRNVKAKKLIHN